MNVNKTVIMFLFFLFGGLLVIASTGTVNTTYFLIEITSSKQKYTYIGVALIMFLLGLILFYKQNFIKKISTPSRKDYTLEYHPIFLEMVSIINRKSSMFKSYEDPQRSQEFLVIKIEVWYDYLTKIINNKKLNTMSDKEFYTYLTEEEYTAIRKYESLWIDRDFSESEIALFKARHDPMVEGILKQVKEIIGSPFYSDFEMKMKVILTAHHFMLALTIIDAEDHFNNLTELKEMNVQSK